MKVYDGTSQISDYQMKLCKQKWYMGTLDSSVSVTL